MAVKTVRLDRAGNPVDPNQNRVHVSIDAGDTILWVMQGQGVNGFTVNFGSQAGPFGWTSRGASQQGADFQVASGAITVAARPQPFSYTVTPTGAAMGADPDVVVDE